MKISLRDLFLVVVIIALALGWWVDRSRLRNELGETKVELTDTNQKLMKTAAVGGSMGLLLTQTGYKIEWQRENTTISVSGPVGRSFSSSGGAPLTDLRRELDNQIVRSQIIHSK